VIGRPRALVRSISPGLVAGASDNDPTTVGTLAVVGATTAFALSWVVVLLLPMLVVIQVIGAQVGVMTGVGLQEVVARRWRRPMVLVFIGSVVFVSVLTIAADLEAGAAALGLLFHIGWSWLVAPLGVVLLALLVVGSYDEVVAGLRWVLLAFVAYVVSAFLAHPRWGAVLRASVVPSFNLGHDDVDGALALLGTTLTSYVFVWQTIEESQEGRHSQQLGSARVGAGLGIGLTVVVFWFILVGTGATLGQHHVHIQTADQAARALQPLAGSAARYVFGVGLLASAVVALPVLMATTAHVVGDSFDWRTGLSQQLTRARRFYAVLAASIALGAAISLVGISPIQILFVASIAGGLGTPFSLLFLLRLAGDEQIMAGRPVSRWLLISGWVVAAVLSGLGLVYLAVHVA
jgi:Mn2+/Fe2+ NRAMP family transporter